MTLARFGCANLQAYLKNAQPPATPNAQREPFAGVGEPEPLRHGLSGFWSRRITEEHRMVSTIEDDALLIAQLRYHY